MKVTNVKERLLNEFHESLYRNTYNNIINRIKPSGYFPESLTGYYQGMFSRTVGPCVFLLLEHKEYEKAKKVLSYLTDYSEKVNAKRFPHVVFDIEEDGSYQVDMIDQPDGHYHVVLAWARYVETVGDKEFEDATYEKMAGWTEYYLDSPYFCVPTHMRVHVPLMFNPSFEHSRDVQMWACWDLLTQVFTAQALREMIDVAKRREDNTRVAFYQSVLNMLEKTVHDRMLTSLDGTVVYAEMLLPDGKAGIQYPGLSWVNLSPIAAEWDGVIPEVFSNTVQAYRKRALFSWQDIPILGCEWDPPGQVAPSWIGKQWAWELLYSCQEEDWNRMCDMLDFLERANSHRLFAENFTINRTTGEIHLSDPANGEQATWYCWAMTKVRNILR